MRNVHRVPQRCRTTIHGYAFIHPKLLFCVILVIRELSKCSFACWLLGWKCNLRVNIRVVGERGRGCARTFHLFELVPLSVSQLVLLLLCKLGLSLNWDMALVAPCYRICDTLLNINSFLSSFFGTVVQRNRYTIALLGRRVWIPS